MPILDRTAVDGPIPPTVECDAPPSVEGVVRFREIADIVEEVSGRWRPVGLCARDRQWQRIVYEEPIVVRPVVRNAAGSYAVDGPELFVSARDLSRGGISFEHESPLPHRYVAISFPRESFTEVAIVTQLTWCRFTRKGHYLAGGRFLQRLQIEELGAE